MTSQIRRCASSITANIAEGFGRRTVKDQLHFYQQSYGSVQELINHLMLARDVGYMTEVEWKPYNARAIEMRKLLAGLMKAHSARL